MRQFLAGLWFLALLPLFVLSKEQQYNIYHRLYHPLLPNTQFRPRGSLSLRSHPTITPVPSLKEDLQQFADALNQANLNSDDVLYQVALDPTGKADESVWDVSAVKVCHLGQVANETFIIHTGDLQHKIPHALDYFVSPIPHEGSCSTPAKLAKPNKNLQEPELSPLHILANKVPNLDTSVIVRSNAIPPFPDLRLPPPLTPDGNPVQPVPEKTFFQKYWMYIAIFLAVLVLSPGGEDEQSKKRA